MEQPAVWGGRGAFFPQTKMNYEWLSVERMLMLKVACLFLQIVRGVLGQASLKWRKKSSGAALLYPLAALLAVTLANSCCKPECLHFAAGSASKLSSPERCAKAALRCGGGLTHSMKLTDLTKDTKRGHCGFPRSGKSVQTGLKSVPMTLTKRENWVCICFTVAGQEGLSTGYDSQV